MLSITHITPKQTTYYSAAEDFSQNFIEDIFHQKYDGHLRLCTYSISHGFLNKISQRISPQKIDVIVGLLDEEYQAKTFFQLQQYEQTVKQYFENSNIAFFNQLSATAQQDLLKRKINLAFPFDRNIHAKTYLLQNQSGTTCRIITGSANLTQQAFNNKQIENIVIIDDDFELFNHYIHDFDNINLQFCTDAYSLETRSLLEKRTKESNKGNEEKTAIKPVFIILNEDEKEKIGVADQKQFAQHVNQYGTKETLCQIANDIQFKKQEINAEKRKVEHVLNLVSETIVPDKKTKQHKIQTNTTSLKSIVRKVTTVKVNRLEDEQDNVYKRLELQRLDAQVDMEDYEGKIIKILPNKQEGELGYQPYSKLLTPEQIKHELAKIDRLIEGYEKYTLHYDVRTGRKIFESILYAFTSPFISYLRQSKTTDEARQHIPMFMFLGGSGGSGKSSLLRILNKMTNEHYDTMPFINYENLSNHTSAAHKTIETIRYLEGLFRENNVMPMMIDEIPEKFFSSNSVDMIKRVSNTADNYSSSYPALIGTTNSQGFVLDVANGRRSYYIKLDNPFNPKDRVASQQYYESLLKEINPELFKDFLCRFQLKLLKTADKQWTRADKNQNLDFLVIAREIFKDYYLVTNPIKDKSQTIENSLPVYFNDAILNDYEESGSEMWRDLFLSNYSNDKKMFNYDKKHDILWFYHHAVETKTSNRHESLTTAQSYLKKCPPNVFKSALNDKAVQTKFDGANFFSWIGLDNPYLSLIDKIVKRFNH